MMALCLCSGSARLLDLRTGDCERAPSTQQGLERNSDRLGLASGVT